MNKTEAQVRAFNDWHLATYGCNAADDAAGLYRYEGWMAAQETTGDRVRIEIRDMHGVRLNEGDIVIGLHEFKPGDGYLPKKAPKTLRALLRVKWDSSSAAYQLESAGVHPDDVVWAKDYFYRRPLYRLQVDNEKNEAGFTVGPREDMVCTGLERLEPTHAEQLLRDMTAQLDGMLVGSAAMLFRPYYPPKAA
jgi:hypothetical protein